MRSSHVIAAIALTGTVFGVALVGCFGAADDCTNTLGCASTGTTGASGSSSSGGGGGSKDGCIPSESAGPVQNDCGIFVELGGDDGAAGTQMAPVKTLTKAIQLAKSGSGRVYACGQAFKEPVEVPPGVSIFGALDCQTDWSYKEGSRTSIETDADVIPLKLTKGSAGARIEDVDVRAADAAAPGGSSIAVIVDGATAAFARCDITAGAGAAGVKGGTPMDDIGSLDNPDDPRVKGADGVNACMGGAGGNPGGTGKTNDLCTESIGGNGGAGGIAAGNGENGTDGSPVGAAMKGKGGLGDTGFGCDPGFFGQNGALGAPGLGATELGVISASGYQGASGQDGAKGSVGQGGGGGGGAKGKAGCNGASGGGGGAGGCGGLGGYGGTGGGASIAMISLDAQLTFTTVKLKTGPGGAGGDGGDGQSGGIGGNGGKAGLTGGVSQVNPGCQGGSGGFGGSGGQAGGGRGGHSIGIAYSGKSPPQASISIGAAGMGGLGADAAGNGAAGEAQETRSFQ